MRFWRGQPQDIFSAQPSRRDFLRTSGWLLAGVAWKRGAHAEERAKELIIDVHQHVQYSGRSDEALIAHQRTLGVTTSVLMPSGDRGGGQKGGSGEHEADR